MMTRIQGSILIAALTVGLCSQAAAQSPGEHVEPKLPQQSTGEAPPAVEQESRQPGEMPSHPRPRPQPPSTAAPDWGGVLTSKGTLILEPAIQFSNAQVNRFTFLGVEITEAFLIGLLDVQDTDRNLVSPQLSARYGLTKRLELEGRIAYIMRDDRMVETIPQAAGGTGNPTTRELEGDGLGDVDLAVHYQLNRGRNGRPFYIGNLRYKSTTGRGPFEVSRNATGQDTELPTGSGFHAIEPGVTAIFPSDPAVFFLNVGYLFNVKDSIDQNVGTSSSPQIVGEVDPGDATRLSFGMAFAVNPRASFTIGYKHDFIRGTSTEIKSSTSANFVESKSSSLQVGAMLLGFGYRLDPEMSINVNLELGVTADAPDVAMTLRVPMTKRPGRTASAPRSQGGR
jgi:hypothetical protein